MPSFQYRALQADGTVAEGQIEAGGRQEAFRHMEARGLRPIRLAENNGPNGAGKSAPKKLPAPPPAESKETKSPLSAKLTLGSSNKVSARMLENFTRLLSSLLAAGVPLSRALVILCKEASAPKFASMICRLIVAGFRTLTSATKRSRGNRCLDDLSRPSRPRQHVDICDSASVPTSFRLDRPIASIVAISTPDLCDEASASRRTTK